MKELLEKLVNIAAPYGFESAMRDAVRAEIEPLADEIFVDALGNLIARVGRRAEDGLRVMLSAHMDEIGIIASHIDENGFVRFAPLGAVYEHNCLGARVRFLNGTRGVIGSPRYTSGDARPGIAEMFIDVGAISRETCPVQVGEPAAFENTFLDLGQRVVAKSLDNRVSVAAQIEIMRRLQTSPHEIYFVFSVQEEVGQKGALVSAYHLQPDLGLALDVTTTGDTPNSEWMAVELGKGPAIKIKDEGMIVDPRVVKLLSNTAEKHNISTQREILLKGTTDARWMQSQRAGAPAGTLSIPCRYVHSPSEMIDLSDVEQAITLMIKLLEAPIQLPDA
jgi:endoglucanase